MSVEAPNTVEETPVTATPDTSDIKKTAMTVPETEHPSEATQTIVGGEPTAMPGKDTVDQVQNPSEAVVVEATPASEGILGYKEPGLLKLLKGYQKHYFWLGDEAVKPESLAGYISKEKPELAHHNASWAAVTGKGVLFYSKREEDKSTPAGLILLSDISKITKEGETEFQFKEGHHYQKFQATNSAERDSWLVALERESEAAKTAKEGIVGSEGYKKGLDAYKAPPAPLVNPAAAAAPKKSLDASTATTAANGVAAHDGAVAEEEKKEAAKDKTSRSRSRGNRKSFFGGLLDKKEKADDSKEVKKEEKAEERAEKKEIKEEKKAEASQKKEEAKETHDSTKAKEAAEAAALAAVPAAAVVAEKKHEEKEEKKSGATTPTEKKAKRGSVFGGIFGKKNVNSSDAEKTDAEAGPAVPAKDSDLPPVSQTAPKIEKPVDQAPLDTAAVVAPVDTVQTPAAEEVPTVAQDKPTTPNEITSTPKQQKEGGGILGFIKKTEAKFAGKKEEKSEVKEDKAAEEVAKDPVAAAAVDPTTETPATTNGEERPVNPQRRSSLLERFGTQRRKANKTSESDGAAPAEAKREKSPLPSKVAGLFRKPSKAVQATEEKTPETNGLTNGHTEATTIPEATESATETKPNVTVPETSDSAIVGDVVPNDLTVHDQVTAAPEVKTSA